MSVCLRPQRILLAPRPFQIRRNTVRYPFLGLRTFSESSRQNAAHAGVQNSGSRSRTGVPCPVPPKLRQDPSEWIKYLTKYVSKDDVKDASENYKETRMLECENILALLFQARSLYNFDLLSILGFKHGRWDDYHAIVNKLLDNAQFYRSPYTRGEMPSNIDWKALGSLSYVSSEGIDSIDANAIQYRKDHRSLTSFDSYSEEPIRAQKMGESETRIGTMEEIWQSLGYFVLEAADLPVEEGPKVMSHLYRVLGRLHHLDMVPHEVYKYTEYRDIIRPNRPPGMYLLSYPIMGVLSDTAWELNYADQAVGGGDTRPQKLTYRSRELGFGVWLEFILWCCVEGGFAKEGTWIMQESRNREKKWSIKSWATVVKTTGPVVPQKMSQYDTWARCGRDNKELLVDRSNRPFLGLGERTITKEVVMALMDGLCNSLETGVGLRGDSPPLVLERMGLLRSLLKSNKIFLQQQDIGYFIARVLEAGSVVLHAKPQTLDLLLNLAPYIRPAKTLANSATHPMTEQAYLPQYSGMILGLYQYSLNIYAERGDIFGALEILEKLLGASDSESVHEVRKFLHAKSPIRSPKAKRLGQPESSIQLATKPPAADSARVHLSSLSNSLLLDTFISSRLYHLADWLVTLRSHSIKSYPHELDDQELIQPHLIRFATATKNPALFTTVSDGLTLPMGYQVLAAVLDYRISECDWYNTIQLLRYLQGGKHKQWSPLNITSLAAVIIRLEAQSVMSVQSEKNISDHKKLHDSLKLARVILSTILRGKYNQLRPYPTYHESSPAVLYQLHRLFSSIPGTLSEVCHGLPLQWKDPFNPDYLIPAKAFNQLLSAIVDTQGSLAGKRLWDRFCIEPKPIDKQRLTVGGNTRLHFTTLEHFSDSRSLFRNKEKLVLPTSTTVRIIAKAATDEQRLSSQHDTFPEEPTFEPMVPEPATLTKVTEVLDWSVQMFERFHLSRRAIDRELDGYKEVNA
ncbi:hypothetical protein FQN57_000046 [Myotisia sp. PD_48]|nr:hypothetical protein FQN57_000046 [Myotisia sp. PD_48]